MLLLSLLAAEGFLVVQYAPKPVSLRGCAECTGEADDVCEVRGLQAQPIGEYLKARWPAQGRLKLIRSKAESDCAVQAKAVLGPGARLELAAVRMQTALPAAGLLDSLGPAVEGWPRRLQRVTKAVSRKPDRSLLREAVVCWPSEHGWPSAAQSDARPLDATNRCEAWLLAVKAETGEPDAGGFSFPLKRASFAFAPPADAARDAQGPSATSAREPPATASREPSALAARESPALAARESPALTAFEAPASSADTTHAVGVRTQASGQNPDPPPPTAAPACGDAARAHAAPLDRFDQWDLQIRGATRASLDRATFTLDAQAWTGHCQELDVLRGVLEQQLSCAVAVSGNCSAEARR
jgi:hypothetical protein